MEQKISGNSFRKFWSTSRGCPFFLEIWKFRKFPAPFGISIQYDLVPSSLSREFGLDQSHKMAASRHYTGCKMICHSSSRVFIAYSPQKRQYLIFEKLWPRHSEFPVGQFAWFARKARKFLSSHENL